MIGWPAWLRRGARRAAAPWDGWPDPAGLNREKLAADMARPPAETRFVMFFTPRSGSSWVADLVTRSRRMGVLGEAFNPNFLPDMARAMNAPDLDTYCQVQMRRRARDGVFGFQITHHQLIRVFGTEADFIARFGDWQGFWLVRRDIVAQAVSLWKMQTAHIAHAPQIRPDQIRAREAGLAYDGPQIRRWLEHVLVAEEATEALIARMGMTPLRMSYEHNITLKPSHLVNVMRRHLGLPTQRMKNLSSPHAKVGTRLNSDFAARFREDYADWLEEVAARRAPILEQITYYGPRRRGGPAQPGG